MSKKRVSKQGAKPSYSFDKYAYYRRAVQAPDSDVDFFRETYKEIRGELPTTLREDFCGTFSICCEWTKLGSRYIAHGVDLDYDPIQYGKSHYLPQLTVAQRERVVLHQKNVLDPELPYSDIVAALNFSFYIFKERSLLKAYFANCYETLNEKGIFIADAFGGSMCQQANEEKTKHRGFTYYWDQESFDPVTNQAVFHIHFKVDGHKKIEKVFSYDWRMWTLPEIREVMLEVGFKKAQVYWEGTTRSGDGDGIFRPAERGEECQAWVAYVVGQK